MADKLDIREATRGDSEAIEMLYPGAFPDEDLLPLVRALLEDAEVTTSLVGTIASRIVGHAIFTKCGVAGSRVRAALLGPLAVAPERQGQGVGSAIVRAGLRKLESVSTHRVFVLGDPAYYGRFGFRPESLVEPPYALPVEWEGAWQSQSLGESTTPCSGALLVPRQWLQPALWAP